MLLCALSLMGRSLSFAQTPPSQPILRIEMGNHTAAINSLAADANGRYLATGSDDKTVRIWDLERGHLQSILRPPIAEGSEGKIYAVAMTPDGQWVAVAGYTGHAWDGAFGVYIFDRARGTLRQRLRALPNAVLAMALSSDGSELAVTLGDRHGIQLYSLREGALLWQDDDYGGDSYGVDINAQGQLVTSCNDGFLRLYDRSHALLAKVRVAGGAREPYAVRFAPDGRKVAVGYEDRVAVDVMSVPGLRLLTHTETTGLSAGHLKSVAWPRDGTLLFAAGRGGRQGAYLRTWNAQGKRAAADVWLARDDVQALVAVSQNRVAFAASDPSWGVVMDNRVQLRSGLLAQMGTDGWLFSSDGTKVRMRHPDTPTRWSEFHVPALTLTAKPDAVTTFVAPRTEHAALPLRGWQGGRDVVLRNRTLTLHPYETSRCVAIAEDGQAFLLGADWSLRWYLADGTQKWQVTAPSTPRSVQLAAAGRLAIAAYSDGSLRWYETAQGRELLVLYLHPDHKRWVLYTPAGVYAASVGGEDLIGWHVNQGTDSAADFFPASRFRAQLYRPEEVAAALTAPAGLIPAVESPQQLPPTVTITAPQDGTSFSADSTAVHVMVRSPTHAPLTGVQVQVNGRPVAARGVIILSVPPPLPQQSPSAAESAPKSAPRADEQHRTLTVPLQREDSVISVIAEAGGLRSAPAVVHLKFDPASSIASASPAAAPTYEIQPKLYVLAIGVSQYQRLDLRLDHPAKDARDLVQALQDHGKGLYRAVEVRLLTDEHANKDAILAGLDWLRRQTTQHDVAVLFLAGHGINDRGNGRYYYLPFEADPTQVMRSMVPGSEIQASLSQIAGKVVLFLDSCHAGNVLGQQRLRGGTDVNRFVNELASAENGVVVFTASTGSQPSQESPVWNNGAFTKAVVEGLRGQADFKRSGRVTINMLDLYVSERVKELTSGSQTPTTAKPTTINDFPIAVAP